LRNESHVDQIAVYQNAIYQKEPNFLAGEFYGHCCKELIKLAEGQTNAGKLSYFKGKQTNPN
jgi:hypothetical protein